MSIGIKALLLLVKVKVAVSVDGPTDLTRKGLPNPWHIVTVQPRTVGGNGGANGRGTGHRYRYRYRYDVMGFPRRGRHRLKDGTYRETVEWVRPHQRGHKEPDLHPEGQPV